MKKIITITILITLFTASFSFSINSKDVQKYTYEIINSFPHDKDAFTQGLYYEDGIMYEGTGLNGKSDLRKNNLKTGQIIEKNELPEIYFGEGITILNDKIYQSTWKSKTMFIYDKNVKLLNITDFPYQCWGLTDNDEYLIMSDGTDKIRYLNPDNYQLIKTLNIKYKGKHINNINELEYIGGKIYANIWQTDLIVVINPENEEVESVIDLSNLINPDDYNYDLDVLNGIAYDQKNDRLFVTGKLWPEIFEIKLIPENK
jgi:glutamine cyclotransferase